MYAIEFQTIINEPCIRISNYEELVFEDFNLGISKCYFIIENN